MGSFAGATLVVAVWAESCGEAGGHKARPYALRFPFNFEDVQDYALYWPPSFAALGFPLCPAS